MLNRSRAHLTPNPPSAVRVPRSRDCSVSAALITAAVVTAPALLVASAIWAPAIQAAATGATPGRPIVGGPCRYEKVQGVVEVHALGNRIGEDQLLDILFFRDPYLRDQVPTGHLELEKISLKTRCIEDEKIKVGSRVNAVRSHIIKGTCTPTLYDFPELKSEYCRR